MNHPSTPGAAPEPIDPEGLPGNLLAELELSISEIEALENSLKCSRQVDVAEAIQELDDADPADPTTRQFVDSVRAQWLSEVRDSAGSADAAQHDALRAGRAARTALLSKGGSPRLDSSRTTVRSFPVWPLAAAAAALAMIGWYGTGDDVGQTPVYLGAGDEPVGEQRQVGSSGQSTAPEVLPTTVDFSGDVPEYVTFRIEIHDVTKSPRVDDGIALEGITYEPKWTCPAPDRRNLPAVFRLEVHQEIEAPGTAPLWSRVYARQ